MDLSILNKFFDKIFIITIEHEFDKDKFIPVDGLLPSANKRKSRIESRMNGLNYDFFYGVDASNYNFKNTTQIRNGVKYVLPQNLTVGQIGCSLSHANLYKLISESEWEKVLILEDDCVFNNEILNFEKYFNQIPDDWGCVFLGWEAVHLNGNISNNVFEMTKTNKKNFHCTHSLAITKKFAKKMFMLNENGDYTADGAFNKIIENNNEKIHFIVPKLSYQENIDCTSYEIDLKYK